MLVAIGIFAEDNRLRYLPHWPYSYYLVSAALLVAALVMTFVWAKPRSKPDDSDSEPDGGDLGQL